MNENKKTMEVSQSAVVLVAVLILAMMGFGGYMYGKVSNLEKTAANNAQQPTAQQQPAPVTVTQDQLKGLFGNGNLAFGDKNSKLVFVEFSDPSCPYCHVAGGKHGELNKQIGPQFTLKADGGTYVAPVPEMKKLVDAGKAAFVWIYANGHGSGETATKALYCANEKGKFWEAHDALMTSGGYTLMNTTMERDATTRAALDNPKNQALTADFLKSVVDANFMKGCLSGGKYDGRLSSDMALAQQFGFNGTPSFFVNTQNYAGAYSYTDMQSAVDAALK